MIMKDIKQISQKNTEQSKAIKTGVISQMPVFNRELELDILASIAFNSSLQCKIDVLKEEDFYILNNKKIYKYFMVMFDKKNIIDIAIIGKRISCVDLIGRQYVALPSQIDLQIEELKKITSKRRLQNIAYDVSIMVEEDRDISDIKRFYDSEIKKVGQGIEVKITTEDIDEEFEEYITQKEVPAIKTGFPKLDGATGGFMNGIYTIIAAAQSVGKTTALINFIVYMCRKLSKKVLLVSLEMNFLALQSKIISNISGVPYSKMMFKMKELNDDECRRINNARATVSKFDISWLGQKEVSTSDIRARLEEENNVDLVMVDYMQILRPAERGRTLYETTTNISRELKILAGEFGIPFIVVASINRDYSDRADYTPHISDIRGSGNIEYDADLVLLLHRESAFREYDEKDKIGETEFKHKAELIIAKNRFGESNLRIPIFFDGAKSLMREMEIKEVENGYKKRKDIFG